MTTLLFRDDAYITTADAIVTAVHERGVVLDRTIFYPAAGGQPGDLGTLKFANADLPIANTQYAEDRTTVLHVLEGMLPDGLVTGAPVALALDWSVRHRHMRMHTALHLLCSLVPHPVTGGQIGASEGRLDFDIPDADAVDKEILTAGLMALIAADHPVSTRWITDDELAANPQLVRTMAVKPPMGTGRVRLVEIGAAGEVDRQPCGGTHVRRTGEIGAVAVTKIEKKGKQNRRIRVAFAS